MAKKSNILILGPVPPPAGGISIHIWRLKHLLDDVYSIDLVDEAPQRKPEFFNIRSLDIFTYLKKIADSHLLFVHSGNRLFKKIHIITGRLFGKKVIITLHGYGAKRKQPFRFWDETVFKLAHKIILVNPTITERISLPAKKCIVKHAFLPPVMEQEAALPEVISARADMANANEQTLICANASRLDLHKGEDLYGLDMCIETTRRLVAKGIPVSFIFTVSAIDGCKDRYDAAQQLILEHNIQDHFLLVNGVIPFVKLVERADVVLRPTNTDGDALTIREALFLGKKTLVSDVTERPAGAILFRTRDFDDLETKLAAMLRSGHSGRHNITGTAATLNNSFRDFYVTLIDHVLNNSKEELTAAVTAENKESILI
ncbi:hypothetical protein [Ferruginibacter sp. HRS2-29]|uniref:hypothetical protein n=1 Tax=Ferruginibacter sp. HRS2-29 TaxID=2487334 RepID=UPI0020CF8B46|nr:hypothetical protein [Ferruginibacter sp. HRS2-29]MCP9751046.1 hypothetical protein [Ferruginibacter sp. HRS2-29]